MEYSDGKNGNTRKKETKIPEINEPILKEDQPSQSLRNLSNIPATAIAIRIGQCFSLFLGGVIKGSA